MYNNRRRNYVDLDKLQELKKEARRRYYHEQKNLTFLEIDSSFSIGHIAEIGLCAMIGCIQKSLPDFQIRLKSSTKMDLKGADILVLYQYKPYFIDIKSKMKNQFYHDFKETTFYLEYDEYGFINMRNFLERFNIYIDFDKETKEELNKIWAYYMEATMY